jgi:hypothetical protein
MDRVEIHFNANEGMTIRRQQDGKWWLTMWDGDGESRATSNLEVMRDLRNWLVEHVK